MIYKITKFLRRTFTLIVTAGHFPTPPKASVITYVTYTILSFLPLPEKTNTIDVCRITTGPGRSVLKHKYLIDTRGKVLKIRGNSWKSMGF